MLMHTKDTAASTEAGSYSSTPLPAPEDVSAEMIRQYVARGRNLRAQYLRDLGRRARQALRRGASPRQASPAGEADSAGSQLFHDLRTPLTSIRSFVELLRANPDLPRGQRTQYLDILLSESRRMETTIRSHEARVR